METKFIKDTNNQYSIREDGVIIRHYSYSKNGTKTKIYKDVVSKTFFNKDRTSLRYGFTGRQGVVKELVVEYFPIDNPYSHIGKNHLKIVPIDGDETNCSIQNLKYVPREGTYDITENITVIEKRQLYHRKRYDLHRDKIILKVREYANTHKKEISERAKSYRKIHIDSIKQREQKGRKDIAKWYIASKLGISVIDIPDDMYQSCKSLLKFKRQVSEEHNISIFTLK